MNTKETVLLYLGGFVLIDVIIHFVFVFWMWRSLEEIRAYITLLYTNKAVDAPPPEDPPAGP